MQGFLNWEGSANRDYEVELNKWHLDATVKKGGIF